MDDVLKLVLSVVPSLVETIYEAIKSGSTEPLGGLQALLDEKTHAALVKAAADAAAKKALGPT